MITAIVEGFLWGLATLFFIGPVVFYLLQSSIVAGWKQGWMVALGIFSGDLVYVVLCRWGLASYFSQKDKLVILAAVGGILLLVMGLKMMVHPNKKTDLKNTKTSAISYFVGGFLINFINPFVLIAWIGFSAYAFGEYPKARHANLFLGFMLLGILTIDSLKVLVAHKTGYLLKENNLKKIFIISGIVVLGFSLRMLYYVYENFSTILE